MYTLEQVEQLRKIASVSYAEAKEALEAAGGDMLEAMIYLEKKGKVAPPPDNGSYNSAKDTDRRYDAEYNAYAMELRQQTQEGDGSFKEAMTSLWNWICKICHKGVVNHLVVKRFGKELFTVPVLLVVLLAVFAFWVCIPLMIVGLFFNFSYSFRGPDLEKESINRVMDTAADAVEDLKNTVKKDMQEDEKEHGPQQ